MTPRPPGRKPNATAAQIAAMLRAGATSRDTIAALHVSPNRVAQVRRDEQLPVVPRGQRARTVAETIALQLQPYGDGHARWTGPVTNGKQQLWANGRRYNARHEIFRAHHGRNPDGPVMTACTDPGCVAGAHLTDRTIRHAQRQAAQLDAAYAEIFGPDAP